jgi:hypothetical protein
MDRTRRIDNQAPRRVILLRRSDDASSSQDKMIVLASNSFEVKMSLCGDPESDVSLFFKVVCSTQEACARKHQECNLTWRGESKSFLGNKCT